MGPGTAEALSSFHLRADLLPAHDYRAEGLLQTLRQTAVGQRFLLALASRGRDLLAAGLLAAETHVEQIVVYDSRDVVQADRVSPNSWKKQQIDWATVAEPAIAVSLVQLFGTRLRQTRLVSISPVTSATLRQQGWKPHIEAMCYTMEGVIGAILQDAAGSPPAATATPS